MVHRYWVEVEGTEIEELYEYEKKYSEEQVKYMWLKHVSQKWGKHMAKTFSDRVDVELAYSDENVEMTE